MAVDAPAAPLAAPAVAPSAPRPPSGLHAAATEFGQLLRFSGQALIALPGTVRYFSEVLRQFARMLPGTVRILVFMEFMMGITAANFVYFLLKSLGATDFTGAGGTLTLRPGAVAMFGFVFVAKVGGGFVSELGAMKINEEVDALESTGVDPMRYAVGTRVMAAILFIPIGTVVTAICFYLGYSMTATVILNGVDQSGLAQFYWGTQSLWDYTYVLVYCAVVSIAGSLVACFYGMRARGGPSEVGSAVARAVIVNLVVVNALGSMICTLFFAGDFKIGLGG